MNDAYNTLPDDINFEILCKAGSHTQFCDEAVREHGAYVAGATEYASKLHLLQQEYDKLRDVHYDLRNQHESLDKAAIRQNELIINLQEQYDKLKAGCLEDYTNLSKQYMALFAEHAALKEKAEAYEMALGEIITRSNAGKTLPQIDSHIAAFARKVLSSYNSNTNQNENNG